MKRATQQLPKLPFASEKPLRLRGEKLARLRRDCWERDGGRCTVKGCDSLLTWYAGYFNSMHMHHILPRGRGGSDTLENVTTLCPKHHAITHSNGAGFAAMHF